MMYFMPSFFVFLNLYAAHGFVTNLLQFCYKPFINLQQSAFSLLLVNRHPLPAPCAATGVNKPKPRKNIINE